MYEPLSNHHLHQALVQVAQREGFAERIAWWLTSPHGAERWLQFELAFELQRDLGDRIAVLCEHRSGSGTASDIVLVTAETAVEPIWESRAAAVIELKLSGNWYFKPRTISSLHADVAKVDKLDVPAIAAVCCLTVCPAETTLSGVNSSYAWISQSLASKIGVSSFQNQREQLCVNGIAYLEAGSSIELTIPGFVSAELSLLVHRNRAAETTST